MEYRPTGFKGNTYEIDFSKLTPEIFVRYFKELISRKSPTELLEIGDVQGILVEYFNNDVLDMWAKEACVVSTVTISVDIDIEHPPVKDPEMLLEEVINEMNYRFLYDDGESVSIVDTCITSVDGTDIGNP